MPRTADPEMEERIVGAALRLLDCGGLEAVTMRAVALQAATSTPTLYERFASRDALIASLVRKLTAIVLEHLRSARSVEKLVRLYVEFSCEHPHRFDLSVATFGARLVAAEPMPVMDYLKSCITRELGLTGRKRDELALAIASLCIGTVGGMLAAGVNTPQAKGLKRASLAAARLLLQGFSPAALRT